MQFSLFVKHKFVNKFDKINKNKLKNKRVKKMPYIIIYAWFPPHKGTEVGVAGQKAIEKFPQDDTLGTTVLPTAFTSEKDGIFAITAFEPKEGKMGDSLDWVANIMSYYQNIEGFTYEIKTFSTTEEATAMAAART